MDITSSGAAVATVFGAVAGLVAMGVVQMVAWRGAGERPCPGRVHREAAASRAAVAAVQAIENEPVLVGYEAVSVTIVAQRGVPSKTV